MLKNRRTYIYKSSEVFRVVMFHVEVFWVMKTCSVVNMQAAWTSETLYPTTKLHGVTTQNTPT